jgi:hypothetical protein
VCSSATRIAALSRHHNVDAPRKAETRVGLALMGTTFRALMPSPPRIEHTTASPPFRAGEVVVLWGPDCRMAPGRVMLPPQAKA